VLDEVLGIGGAWLSDESSVGDFLSPLDSPAQRSRSLELLSAKLGFPLEAKTLIADVLDLMAGMLSQLVVMWVYARATPFGRCPGPASAGWCAPLGLRLLSPPGPSDSDRETSIIKKSSPEFRHPDTIRHGNDDGSGEDAERKTGGPGYLLRGGSVK